MKMLVAGLCLSLALHQDCHAQQYRTIGNEKFRVVDTAGFYIYSINKLVQGEKISRAQDVYYFSVKADDPVEELTMANLESAFAGNPKFRYALGSAFRSDHDLTAYDKALKEYKIKYLYSQSIR